MKSLITLWQLMADDLAIGCCTSATRDLNTVMSRCEDEGVSFLTITLPNFGKDFEKSLDLGKVDPSAFLGFSRKQGLPRFLGGFLDLIFDRASGVLLDVPNVDAIYAVRQLTLTFAKINLPCSPARVKSALDQYVECEKDVRSNDALMDEQGIARFKRVAALLWSNVFADMEKSIADGTIVPKHGPGATADRLAGNRKYDQREWTQRLDRIFPVGDFLLPNYRYYKYLARVDILEPGSERPVRVITVPKTLKTPRIIAIEPTCMQYVQQAISERLVEDLQNRQLCMDFIGFSDQVPNRTLAKKGSRNGSLATLDLSEASDRVSNRLVQFLFSGYGFLSEGIQACRSSKADVDGEVIDLAKFASMGSALCFPVEALVFTTLIFCGIEETLNRPLTLKDLKGLEGRVRVYGDDIIVPVEFVHSSIKWLEDFGLKVNKGKSFWTGKFRESCGGDFYDGHWVTPVRVREMIPSSRSTSPGGLISTVSLRNQLYDAGLWRAARYLDSLLERLIPFPAVARTSPALGRHSHLGYDTHKVCPKLHRPLVKAFAVRPTNPPSRLDDIGALVKFFLKRGELPFADERHLERYGRDQAVNIKLGWAPAH